MGGNPLDAVELALALYRAPRRVEQVRRQPLPHGIELLLRIAGGDERARLDANVTGAKASEVSDAARFYVQQALFSNEDDPYRVLGVERDASTATIKEHHRLLIRFLHPDRSDGSGLDVYAERINRSWNALRTPERRAQTDQRLAFAPAGWSEPRDSRSSTPQPAFVRAPAPATIRRPLGDLAPWVLGATTLIAVVAVSWAWLESTRTPEPTLADAAAIEAPTSHPDAAIAAARAAAAADTGFETPMRELAPAVQSPRSGTTEGTRALAGSASEPVATLESPVSARDPAPIAVPGALRAVEAGRAEVVAAPAVEPAAPVATRARAGDASAQEASDATRSAEPRSVLADTSARTPAADARPAYSQTEPHALPPRRTARPAGPAARTAAHPTREDGTVSSTEPASVRTRPGTVAIAATAPTASSGDVEASASHSMPAAPPSPTRVTRDNAEAVLADFSAAYSRGDLASFLTLFSADARNNRGGLEAIAEDYRQFFAGSGTRRIQFDDIDVMSDKDRATTTARFAAEIWPPNKGRPKLVSGRIQFDLRRSSERVLIERLLHRESDSGAP